MKKLLHKSLAALSFGIFLSFVSFTHAQAELPQDIQQKIEAAANDESDEEGFVELVVQLAKENPDLVGDIVRAAIMASEAGKELVGLLVEAVGNALPESLSVIVDSAVVAAPDAILEINNAGSNVATSANITFVPVVNPLDFPGTGDVGPKPGSDGGNSVVEPGLQVDGPVITNPPVVTDPNPPTP